MAKKTKEFFEMNGRWEHGWQNVGIVVDGDGDINKMVGSMGGVTYAEDMYENGNKIGIMGSEDGRNCEPPPQEHYAPQPGDVMIDFQTGKTTVYGE